MKARASRGEGWANFWVGQWHSLVSSFRKEFVEPKKSEVALSVLWVVVGNLLLSLGASLFLVPGDIVTGGTSGIALVIDAFYAMATGSSLEGILAISHLITICTVFFFVLGYFLLGFGFTLKTLISTIVYPLGIYLFDYLKGVVQIGGVKLFLLETYVAPTSSGGFGYDPTAVMILAGIFGGILMGAGVAFSFRGGGSTGGTDCIVVWLRRKFGLSNSAGSFGIDFIIIFLGLFAYQDMVMFLVGLVASLLCAFVIERVFSGTGGSYEAEIISAKWRSISDAINRDMERGTTLFYAEGGYTGFERKVVKVSFTRSEYRDLIRIVKGIDRYAFITIADVDEIHGNGFSYDDREEPFQIALHHSDKEMRKGQARARRLQEDEIRKNEDAVQRDLDTVRKQERKESKKQRRG